MILTKEEILKEIKKGNIKIEPFNIKSLGPGSYDLTLDDTIRTFKLGKACLVSERIDWRKLTRKIKIKDHYLLQPGETILAITKEKITLADNIAAWLQGRSRFARLGLLPITAAYVQPGSSNRQILEIFNAGVVPLIIKPGVKIVQIIFQRCAGASKYVGKFSKQLAL